MSKATISCTAAEVLAKRRADREQLGFTQLELNEAIFTYGSEVHSIIDDVTGEFIQELFSDLQNRSLSAEEFALSIQGAVNRGRQQ